MNEHQVLKRQNSKLNPANIDDVYIFKEELGR